MIYCIFAFSLVAAVMSCVAVWFVRTTLKAVESINLSKAEAPSEKAAGAEPVETAADFDKKYAVGMKNILAYEYDDARKAVMSYGEEE